MGSVLAETYGIMVYQEQVMQVAQVIGGYTLGGADLLRRAMGKKLKQEMVRHRAIFVAGAAKNGVSEKVANEIFDLMAKFAGYGFNKSHAVAYSYVAYQTAYLKAHYPAEFMAANMCLILTDSDKIRTFIDDCKLRGISILPPDINQSDWFFTAPDSKTIRYGLGGIKGVGEGVILSLMAERKENGPFKDLFDLCARMKKRDSAGLSRRVLEGLIKAGTLDTIDPDRAKQFGNLDQAMKAAADAALFADQGSLFGDASEPERIVNWIPVTPLERARKAAARKGSDRFLPDGAPLRRMSGRDPEIHSGNHSSDPRFRPPSGARSQRELPLEGHYPVLRRCCGSPAGDRKTRPHGDRDTG